MKILFVELVVAVLTKPHETVELSFVPLAFDHQPYRICASDRVMRNARRQEEHFARSDGYFDRLSVLLDLHLYIAFELVKKLLTLVPVIVLSRIGAADYHD